MLKKLYHHILDNCELQVVTMRTLPSSHRLSIVFQVHDPLTRLFIVVKCSPTTFDLTLRGENAVATVECTGYSWSHPGGDTVRSRLVQVPRNLTGQVYGEDFVRSKLTDPGRWFVSSNQAADLGGTMSVCFRQYADSWCVQTV